MNEYRQLLELYRQMWSQYLEKSLLQCRFM